MKLIKNTAIRSSEDAEIDVLVLSIGGKRLPIGKKYVDDVMARLQKS